MKKTTGVKSSQLLTPGRSVSSLSSSATARSSAASATDSSSKGQGGSRIASSHLAAMRPSSSAAEKSKRAKSPPRKQPPRRQGGLIVLSAWQIGCNLSFDPQWEVAYRYALQAVFQWSNTHLPHRQKEHGDRYQYFSQLGGRSGALGLLHDHARTVVAHFYISVNASIAAFRRKDKVVGEEEECTEKQLEELVGRRGHRFSSLVGASVSASFHTGTSGSTPTTENLSPARAGAASGEKRSPRARRRSLVEIADALLTSEAPEDNDADGNDKKKRATLTRNRLSLGGAGTAKAGPRRSIVGGRDRAMLVIKNPEGTGTAGGPLEPSFVKENSDSRSSPMVPEGETVIPLLESISSPAGNIRQRGTRGANALPLRSQDQQSNKDAAVQRGREAALSHPDVQRAINFAWKLLPKDQRGHLTRAHHHHLFRTFFDVFCVDCTVTEAPGHDAVRRAFVEQDWRCRSDGRPTIDSDQFQLTILVTCDAWCETSHPDEYIGFVLALIQIIKRSNKTLEEQRRQLEEHRLRLVAQREREAHSPLGPREQPTEVQEAVIIVEGEGAEAPSSAKQRTLPPPLELSKLTEARTEQASPLQLGTAGLAAGGAIEEALETTVDHCLTSSTIKPVILGSLGKKNIDAEDLDIDQQQYATQSLVSFVAALRKGHVPHFPTYEDGCEPEAPSDREAMVAGYSVHPLRHLLLGPPPPSTDQRPPTALLNAAAPPPQEEGAHDQQAHPSAVPPSIMLVNTLTDTNLFSASDPLLGTGDQSTTGTLLGAPSDVQQQRMPLSARRHARQPTSFVQAGSFARPQHSQQGQADPSVERTDRPLPMGGSSASLGSLGSALVPQHRTAFSPVSEPGSFMGLLAKHGFASPRSKSEKQEQQSGSPRRRGVASGLRRYTSTFSAISVTTAGDESDESEKTGSSAEGEESRSRSDLASSSSDDEEMYNATPLLAPTLRGGSPQAAPAKKMKKKRSRRLKKLTAEAERPRGESGGPLEVPSAPLAPSGQCFVDLSRRVSRAIDKAGGGGGRPILRRVQSVFLGLETDANTDTGATPLPVPSAAPSSPLDFPAIHLTEEDVSEEYFPTNFARLTPRLKEAFTKALGQEEGRLREEVAVEQHRLESVRVTPVPGPSDIGRGSLSSSGELLPLPQPPKGALKVPLPALQRPSVVAPTGEAFGKSCRYIDSPARRRKRLTSWETAKEEGVAATGLVGGAAVAALEEAAAKKEAERINLTYPRSTGRQSVFTEAALRSKRLPLGLDLQWFYQADPTNSYSWEPFAKEENTAFTAGWFRGAEVAMISVEDEVTVPSSSSPSSNGGTPQLSESKCITYVGEMSYGTMQCTFKVTRPKKVQFKTSSSSPAAGRQGAATDSVLLTPRWPLPSKMQKDPSCDDGDAELDDEEAEFQRLVRRVDSFHTNDDDDQSSGNSSARKELAPHSETEKEGNSLVQRVMELPPLQRPQADGERDEDMMEEDQWTVPVVARYDFYWEFQSTTVEQHWTAFPGPVQQVLSNWFNEVKEEDRVLAEEEQKALRQQAASFAVRRHSFKEKRRTLGGTTSGDEDEASEEADDENSPPLPLGTTGTSAAVRDETLSVTGNSSTKSDAGSKAGGSKKKLREAPQTEEQWLTRHERHIKATLHNMRCSDHTVDLVNMKLCSWGAAGKHTLRGIRRCTLFIDRDHSQDGMLVLDRYQFAANAAENTRRHQNLLSLGAGGGGGGALPVGTSETTDQSTGQDKFCPALSPLAATAFTPDHEALSNHQQQLQAASQLATAVKVGVQQPSTRDVVSVDIADSKLEVVTQMLSKIPLELRMQYQDTFSAGATTVRQRTPSGALLQPTTTNTSAATTPATQFPAKHTTGGTGDPDLETRVSAQPEGKSEGGKHELSRVPQASSILEELPPQSTRYIQRSKVKIGEDPIMGTKIDMMAAAFNQAKEQGTLQDVLAREAHKIEDLSSKCPMGPLGGNWSTERYSLIGHKKLEPQPGYQTALHIPYVSVDDNAFAHYLEEERVQLLAKRGGVDAKTPQPEPTGDDGSLPQRQRPPSPPVLADGSTAALPTPLVRAATPVARSKPEPNRTATATATTGRSAVQQREEKKKATTALLPPPPPPTGAVASRATTPFVPVVVTEGELTGWSREGSRAQTPAVGVNPRRQRTPLAAVRASTPALGTRYDRRQKQQEGRSYGIASRESGRGGVAPDDISAQSVELVHDIMKRAATTPLTKPSEDLGATVPHAGAGALSAISDTTTAGVGLLGDEVKSTSSTWLSGTAGAGLSPILRDVPEERHQLAVTERNFPLVHHRMSRTTAGPGGAPHAIRSASPSIFQQGPGGAQPPRQSAMLRQHLSGFEGLEKVARAPSSNLRLLSQELSPQSFLFAKQRPQSPASTTATPPLARPASRAKKL